MAAFDFSRKVVALNSSVHHNLKIAADKANIAFSRDTGRANGWCGACRNCSAAARRA